jgi:hypothetical protein
LYWIGLSVLKCFPLEVHLEVHPLVNPYCSSVTAGGISEFSEKTLPVVFGKVKLGKNYDQPTAYCMNQTPTVLDNQGHTPDISRRGECIMAIIPIIPFSGSGGRLAPSAPPSTV